VKASNIRFHISLLLEVTSHLYKEAGRRMMHLPAKFT